MKETLQKAVTFSCRFHPTDWWHEIGCPHKSWTVEELQSALITAKQTIAHHIELFKASPHLLDLDAPRSQEEDI